MERRYSSNGAFINRSTVDIGFWPSGGRPIHLEAT